jgi:transposase-like protein
MNSAELFCPNLACPARGVVGKGNIRVHSEKTKRYICHVCEQTFSASQGTLFCRLHTDPKSGLLGPAYARTGGRTGGLPLDLGRTFPS